MHNATAINLLAGLSRTSNIAEYSECLRDSARALNFLGVDATAIVEITNDLAWAEDLDAWGAFTGCSSEGWEDYLPSLRDAWEWEAVRFHRTLRGIADTPQEWHDDWQGTPLLGGVL